MATFGSVCLELRGAHKCLCPSFGKHKNIEHLLVLGIVRPALGQKEVGTRWRNDPCGRGER